MRRRTTAQRAGHRNTPITVAGLAVATALFTGCAPAGGGASGVVSPAPSGTNTAGPTAESPGDLGPAFFRPAGEPAAAAVGLAAPWSAVALADGTRLVSERDSGDVVEVDADGATRVAGTVAEASAGGEGGLHGLAVPPGDEGWLYAYVGTADDNRVVRMTIGGAPGARTLGSPEVVVDGIPRDRVHNGGRIAFGPDGMLYVATGDASERDVAQDRESLAGKILRVTPEGEPAPGNPFGTAVYSYGHRNVQGLAWTADGTLWASEFGQDSFDELNRIEPGGNYGWPVHEGAGGGAEFVDPVLTWAPADASPSGLAAAGDTLFVASLRGERVWAVDVSGGAVVGEPEALWAGEFGRIRDAVVAGDDLWLLTNNTDGRGSPSSDDDRLLRVPLAAS
ncbi:PQQ-dependent sugar dehydrogenase [Microbacterium radiodurans]|uniref:PQQ-dependent sugar dehydrogenase n=1 Tax=Microbacterium radiodurans TaxID=661398 RepID=A0A5J5IRZ7_9MICO|nr:PQQ-dependent sugar dehydrogenase [Microbacterium radiodurans]KAA9085231.1 PQQ-dependent sugar dehydrogenase [Microbacterium radiodurans]